MNRSRVSVATVLASLVGPLLPGCASAMLCEQPLGTRAQATPQEQTMTIEAKQAGYAEVNGVRLYHEIYGAGEPLVLLHGGLMTIREMAPLVQALAAERQVVAVELQGHGRTADTERPLRLETMGDDVAALIEHLGWQSADVAGYSLGGDVALRTAIQHPDRVRRLVVLSVPYARSGWYPEVREGMAQVNSKLADALKETPTALAARDWPQPERFAPFLDKLGAVMTEDYDWSAEIRRLRMPVLLVYADHDAVSTRHIAEFFALLGGGLADPGWQNAQLTHARLAIIPGYTHYNLSNAPELGPLIESFLAAPFNAPH